MLLTLLLLRGKLSVMENLIFYLNRLPPEDRDQFIMRLVERGFDKVTENYLRKAKSAKQLLRPALCVAIEVVTSGAVTRRDLRPDDWARIWPELADGAGAIHVEEAA